MRQFLVPNQLVVLLVIVVCLVVVIVRIAICIVVLTARVVGTTIQALLVFRGIVPSVVGLLNAVPSDKLHQCVITEVGCL